MLDPQRNINFFPLTPKDLLISWEEKIDQSLVGRLLNYKAFILRERGDHIQEIVHTYHTLLIKYKEKRASSSAEQDILRTLIASSTDRFEIPTRLLHLPVCYDPEWGIDLEKISKTKNFSIDQIIELHTQPTYQVYFIGFLPGFPYLGGLSESLFIDRKRYPQRRIIKGAVGIGGHQTGIYPSDSPGGWHIIGHCPVPLFNAHQSSPCLLKPGDYIKFHSVNKETHNRIQAEVRENTFHPKEEPWK